MQRLNRSAHAPLGTVFFLFLGLAILPVSLRAMGVTVSFNPRLAAAMDAWQQMAEVFGVNYGPGTGSQPVIAQNINDASSADSAKSTCESACVAKNHAVQATQCDSAQASTTDPKAARIVSRRCCASKRITPETLAGLDRLSMIGQGAVKLAVLAHEELFNSIEMRLMHKTVEQKAEIRNISIPKNVKLLVRMKRGIAPSATRLAECKGFAALASAKRRVCEQAMLTGVSYVTLDSSEF